MSKTNLPSPSAVIVPPETKDVTDAKGRVLTVKRITLLDRFKISKLLGQDSINPGALAMAIIASGVTAIDGIPQPFPHTTAVLDALLVKLGDEGFVAAAQAFPADDTDAALVADQAKN